MATILITDSLFIFKEHEDRLTAAGFTIERLNKPQASEEELITAVKGKVGYILGGIEHVTENVIDAADMLKAIVFTGADWAGFIPGHPAATRKGIAIANSPGANAPAVAEYTVTLLLMMLRHTLELGSTGTTSFLTTPSIADVEIGIVGLGRIGQQVAKKLKCLGATQLYYWNRTEKPEIAEKLGLTYLPLPELFSRCSVISNHLSSQAGEYFTKELLDRSSKGTLFINTGAHTTFNVNALYELLAAGSIRAAFDFNIHDDRFKTLPLSNWFASNEGTGFNTASTLQRSSDMATTSILNILETGSDQYIANL